jgi:hypothetical protein
MSISSAFRRLDLIPSEGCDNDSQIELIQINYVGCRTLRCADAGSHEVCVDGIGIAYTLKPMAELFLRTGQLVRVLEE